MYTVQIFYLLTGRAGRLEGTGHAYRLYSSAVFDQQFEPFREVRQSLFGRDSSAFVRLIFVLTILGAHAPSPVGGHCTTTEAAWNR